MQLDSIPELCLVRDYSGIGTLVCLKLWNAIVEDIARFQHMDWVKSERGDQRCCEINEEAVWFDDRLFII